MKGLRLLMGLMILAGIFLALSSYAEGIDVIRNGTFDQGLDEWNLNPRLTVTDEWLIVDTGSNKQVNLHPEIGDFMGTVIYQNLNVSGIASKEMNISCKLTNPSYNMSDGRTVAIYITYVDASGNLVRQKVLNPENKDITSDTPVSGSFTFPSGAIKLTKIEIAKEYYGQFLIDDISLTVDGTVGNVPKITSSSVSANYNQEVTIQGTNFGNQQGSIKILSPVTGKPVYNPAVTIVSWSDNQITFKVQEPGRSGRIVVVSDYVESNNDKTLEVTSPNFTVDFMEDEITVLKGEKAQFVIKVDFNKGFATQNGISFSVKEPYEWNRITTFSPVPIKSPGGVIMEIDTQNLVPGTYEGEIQTFEDQSYARFASFKLKVNTVQSLVFKECGYDQSYNYTCNTITEKNITKQGELPYIYFDATDNEGNLIYDAITKIKLISSDPTKLLVYESWGYSFYANESGNVEIRAIAPDGTVLRTLPVNISLPDSPKVTSISINPNTVTNKYTGIVSITGYITGTASHYTNDSRGNIYTIEDTGEWNDNHTVFSRTFKIDHSKTNLGDYAFYVGLDDISRWAILSITNDSTYSALKPLAKSIDPNLQFFENFKIQLYDVQGNLVTEKEYFSHGLGNIIIGAIEPGQYKVKIVPMNYGQGEPLFEPQFFPNAKTVAEAQPVQFNAGEVVTLPFFLRKPQLSEDEVALNNVLNAILNAYNSEDLTTFMSYVSDNYMDNGEDKARLQEAIQNQFNDPNFTQIQVIGKTIEISGDLATVNLTFTNGDKATLYFKKENGNWLLYGNQQKYEINLSSHHFQDGYYVNVWIDDENEKIQSATISGPGITGSLGLTKQGSGWSLTQSAFISSTQPAGDQIYTIQITDKNSVTDTYQKKITGYVEQFATNLSPTGTVLNQITFSWTGITGAKRYHIELMKNDYSRIWNKYDIAPTLNNTYSVNYDGPPLEQGTYRYFIVSVVETDGMDNFSFAEGQFTYVVQTPYSISGYVKLSDNTTPVSGATVKARNYTTLQIVSEVQTNEQGYFKLPISTTGEYEITVEKAGYEIITPPSTPYLITEDVPDIVLEFPILLQAVGTEAGIIILNRGWNFVSFPKTPPQGSTIEQIMAQKDIRIIWSYNNQTKQWLRWKPAGENNTLTNIEAGKGYWIYANSQQEIDISDWATPTSTQVTLYDGWNLVGWMGENGKALSEALASVNWVIVWGWENGTWSAKHYQLQNLPYPPVENFYQGKAYWIKVNTGSTGTTWQQGML